MIQVYSESKTEEGVILLNEHGDAYFHWMMGGPTFTAPHKATIFPESPTQLLDALRAKGIDVTEQRAARTTTVVASIDAGRESHATHEG